MNTYSKTTDETLVAFHVGRGGMFFNPGHTKFIGQDISIDNFTSDLFPRFKNEGDFADHENLDTKNANGADCLLDCFTNQDYATLENEYGISKEQLGEYIYTDLNGSPVGLAVENDGTGIIDIDRSYNTTYVTRLSEISEEEASLIIEYSGFKSYDVEQYIFEKFPNLKQEDSKN